MFFSKQLLSLAGFSALMNLASAQNATTPCARTATVKPGDTCDILCARENVSTYQLAINNEGVINDGCSNLEVGQELCLGLEGKDCNVTTVVHAGDTCESIAHAANIVLMMLWYNNPNIGQCPFGLPYEGEVLCTDNVTFNYTT